jgi:prevent-host-death family protein
MTTLNIHEAKTQLSRLVERAAQGETITIARSGKPIAQLTPLEATPASRRRLGFLQGRFDVPDDFDTMGGDTLVADFGGPE